MEQKNLSEIWVIKSDLLRIVECFEDLHGKFHLMCTIYHFNYGFMSQPFQTVLGWKHTFRTKVKKSYQQCYRLALIIFHALNKRIFGEYLVGKEDSWKQKVKNNHYRNS